MLRHTKRFAPGSSAGVCGDGRREGGAHVGGGIGEGEQARGQRFGGQAFEGQDGGEEQRTLEEPEEGAARAFAVAAP